MRPKNIIYGAEAREKLTTGVNKLANAVTTTLSPKGRNVALGQPFGQAPKVLHDGVSVAKEIVLKDQFENMGASLAKEAAERTNDQVGDGTTTAILLTQKITELGMAKINNGVNPMLMKNGIDKAIDAVVKDIKRLSVPIEHKDWESVAILSAQHEVIGKKIVEALELVGDNGLIEVEEGKGTDITIEHKEGMTYDSGYLSPYFCKSPQELVATVEDAYILITDYRITEFDDFMPLLEKLTPISKNLVIIADSVEDDALNGLVMNKLRGSLNVLVPRAPYFGLRRKGMLEDIAAVTGGTVVTESKGIHIHDDEIMNYLGRADMVRSDKTTTSIVGGRGKKTDIERHIKAVKVIKEQATQPHEKENITTRLAKLTGGVAVIQVGASSESEMKNLKERVIDAKGATQAAIVSGIVAGGGVTILNAVKVLDHLEANNSDEQAGIDLIREVAQEPIKLLAVNAGVRNPEHVLFNIQLQDDPAYGYNVLTGEYGDMFKMAIVEPALLAISSLRNAGSAASMILTTECLVDEEPNETHQKN